MLTATLRALRRNHAAKVAVGVIALVVLVGVFAPLIAPHDPNLQNLQLKLRPPFWMDGSEPGYLLGTDKLGRDVLSRVMYGTRVSLLVGLAATLLSGVVGAAVGVVSGYYRGWREQVFMRLADVQLAFPSILLALAIIAVLGPSLLFLILVLGLTGWVSYARVVRAEVLSLREREFVTAARAIGDTGPQIMVRHLLPNIVAPLATIGTLQVAAMIVAEASLSYLGLGVPPSVPTWGSMLADGQLYLRGAWWIAVFSGAAIMMTTLAINVTGDLLRDVADPKAYHR
ncbi:ABC transporter permease [Nonomuraea fuscirosea]|jgi:peptide/nickel transport system permease protein|uniref:Peptide/nickel transport system permease protein n=1 Tax=Nonomuraea fuscirosea TaxID=1291556 RepID=A0A2T0NB50_9ACTN|nr:ABC transporter permease [Nonomuraea fuscirosea]PRX70217.1 peptide/nickel transport system permease protein [Nonomuraea fuscirosea]WSA54568.1 ABC transporter permease [Nonomuraea fuscirosea]